MKRLRLSNIKLKYLSPGIILLARVLLVTACDGNNGPIIDEPSTYMLNIEKTSIFNTDDRELLVHEENVVDDWLAYPDYSDINGKVLLNSSGSIYTGDKNDDDFSKVIDGYRGEWSPDGEKIAFNKSGDIYIADSDGSNDFYLTSGLHPSWSPDGDWIVYYDNGVIYRINSEGNGDPHEITEGMYPHWGN